MSWCFVCLFIYSHLQQNEVENKEKIHQEAQFILKHFRQRRCCNYCKRQEGFFDRTAKVLRRYRLSFLEERQVNTVALKNISGEPDDTWRGYGFFPPVQNSFFRSKPETNLFVSFRQRNKQTIPLCKPHFSASLVHKLFICFTVCCTTYFFITFCWTIVFQKKILPHVSSDWPLMLLWSVNSGDSQCML